MLIRRALVCLMSAATVAGAVAAAAPPEAAPAYDVVISGGTVYDGSDSAPFLGDVAIRGDRIVYVGPHAPLPAHERVDAHGKAVAPGFVNMLAHPERSLLYLRLTRRGNGQMPPLASHLVDQEATAVIREWIAGMK